MVRRTRPNKGSRIAVSCPENPGRYTITIGTVELRNSWRGQGGPKQFGPRNRSEPVQCHELSADLTAVELPRHAEAIADPSKRRAKAVVCHRHHLAPTLLQNMTEPPNLIPHSHTRRRTRRMA